MIIAVFRLSREVYSVGLTFIIIILVNGLYYSFLLQDYYFTRNDFYWLEQQNSSFSLSFVALLLSFRDRIHYFSKSKESARRRKGPVFFYLSSLSSTYSPSLGTLVWALTHVFFFFRWRTLDKASNCFIWINNALLYFLPSVLYIYTNYFAISHCYLTFQIYCFISPYLYVVALDDCPNLRISISSHSNSQCVCEGVRVLYE